MFGNSPEAPAPEPSPARIEILNALNGNLRTLLPDAQESLIESVAKRVQKCGTFGAGERGRSEMMAQVLPLLTGKDGATSAADACIEFFHVLVVTP